MIFYRIYTFLISTYVLQKYVFINYVIINYFLSTWRNPKLSRIGFGSESSSPCRMALIASRFRLAEEMMAALVVCCLMMYLYGNVTSLVNLFSIQTKDSSYCYILKAPIDKSSEDCIWSKTGSECMGLIFNSNRDITITRAGFKFYYPPLVHIYS